MDKDEALEKFSRSRAELLNSIEGLSEQQMTQEAVEGTWTIKDVLAHLTSWERTLLNPLVDYAQGGDFLPEVIPDDLAWNDEQAAEWQEKSLQTVFAELHETRQAMMEHSFKLNDAQWKVQLPAPWRGHGTIADLISGLSWHEDEHLESIQAWLEKKQT